MTMDDMKDRGSSGEIRRRDSAARSTASEETGAVLRAALDDLVWAGRDALHRMSAAGLPHDALSRALGAAEALTTPSKKASHT
jgi:hypothetical protein